MAQATSRRNLLTTTGAMGLGAAFLPQKLAAQAAGGIKLTLPAADLSDSSLSFMA